MKCTIVGFVALLITAVVAKGSDLTIALKTDHKTVAEIILKIRGDLATATVGGQTEQFDLKKMSWLDEKTGRWTSLAQCKKWADESKAKAKKSAEEAPPHLRPYVRWSLAPTFKVNKSNDTLRLISGHVDYVITGECSNSDVDAYYRYAVLNAYKKAMIEQKMPPFSELKAIESMKRLGYIPRRIAVTFPVVPGVPPIELELSEPKPAG